MGIQAPAQRLTVYVGETDRWQGQPLYHAIVLKARELGLAGATVYRGIEGFGANSRVHTARVLELSGDLPVIVEIIDHADRLRQILPFLDEAVQEGLVVLEDVEVVAYRRNRSRGRRPAGGDHRGDGAG
ncbi:MULTISPECIES: DUF190 domain-containing protein [Thermaerobacter]|uniref:DUF190 domain-containing protein n=1 Tax=Thermaerobacter composti TaxID=554949 RepID=A0ABZ0QPN6_9FIRM|nr:MULTISPECIES: DUF190 domain-containing protein [Thermaerobacter]PZN09476.1 MAG: hypothetical protein DIU76_00150 [Bacillota bacterium]QBS38305.1 DUF190 domain-containing protein [Thermaerobacter sp. FW80]WPD18380.1 DUF190 domain-containing protein [Thermaerobacter composti]